MKNPRGENPGAVEIVIEQTDSIAPSLKFQLRNASRVDAAKRRDRIFFARHPFLMEYTRVMSGEFSPSEFPIPLGYKAQGFVRVRRITANVRARTVLGAMIVPEQE